ncbi:MAG TPA: META domain-containing protein [Geminicoccaceae bacterium]|nr:META domain-containing protein [Geminicoccaceae bacterium]
MWMVILVLALGLALQGCSSGAPVERELIVAPAPVACSGDPPGTCLRVSEPDGDTWLMRFDEIDGFAFEPGYTYEVVVEEPPVNQEFAVVPRLRLVRVASRQPAELSSAADPLVGSAWRLQSISGSAAERSWPESGITASFHLGGGWVDGFAGCDRYLAALAADGQKLTISAPETAPELCAGDAAARQRTYLHALSRTQSYTLTGEELELTLAGGGRMLFRAGDRASSRH